jgi:hypothetical protein
MFQYHHIATSLILGVMSAAGGYAQDAVAPEALAPQAELSGMSVSILNSVERSTLLCATIRIDNATNQELAFGAGSQSPSPVSLHEGAVVVPGRMFVENASSESDWPAEAPLDARLHISPQGSRTIQVTFRLIDPQEGRHGLRFIEVTGSRGDQDIHTSVPLVTSPAQVAADGLPWEGGG